MLELESDTMEVRLNDADRAILTEISENGRATTSLLAEEVDVSRTYTAERVRRLREHEYLTEVAPRVYDLTEKGGTEVGETPGDNRLEGVREERDQLADDLEEARGEINAFAEQVETLQDQLAATPDRGEIEAAIEDLEAACEQGDRNGVDVALDRLREAAGIDDE